VKANSASTR